MTLYFTNDHLHHAVSPHRSLIWGREVLEKNQPGTVR